MFFQQFLGELLRDSASGDYMLGDSVLGDAPKMDNGLGPP